MAGAPRRRGPIVFMAVWVVVWAAMMLVVVWLLGAAALRGDLGAAPFLLIWLAFAGIGLWAGVRRLQEMAGLVRPPDPPPASANHVWRDAAPPPPPAPGGRGDAGGAP